MAAQAQPGKPSDEAIDLRFLVERYLDGVALIVDRRIRFANRKLRELTGYTQEESTKMTLTDFLVEEDRERAAERIAELLAFGEEYPSTYRILRKDGSTTTAEALTRVIEYRGKKAFLIVIRDVSDREKSEDRLRAEEERYRNLYHDNPTMYFTVDQNGIVKSVNNFGAGQLGYEPHELEGGSVLRVFLEEDHPVVRETLKSCMASKDGPQQWELRKIRKDGSILWVEERARTVRDADGNPLLLIVCEDITERKRVERSLRTREAQLSVLSELASDCCWVRWEHPDGRSEREWISGSFERLSGYTPAEFDRVGRKGLVHPEDYERTQQMITGPSGGSEHEFRIVTKSGQVRWLRERMRLVKQEGGVLCAYGATRDVTDEKKAEEELRVSREQLAQSQRLESLGKLAGGVAHDFNNSLMVIMGYGDMLETGIDAGDPLRKHATAIRLAAERAATLTGQLLAFSRKQTLQPLVCKIETLISNMTGMLDRLVPEGIELRVQLDPITAAVRIDPNQIEQVVMNLIVNSCDAISSVGRIDIETRRVVADRTFLRQHPLAQAGEYALLEVRDDGCGMDKQTQERIFEPFFTTKGPTEGTGLGLSAVYGIVKQSGGYVNMISEPGKGATIQIFLPLTDEAMTVPAARSQEQIRGGSETLLLVEDEAGVRRLIFEALTSLGYAVLLAATPGEALRLSNEHEGPIQLMITDVVMPEMNGKQLAERLGAERPDTRVLFISGYSGDSMGKHGALDADIAFLQKPVSLDELGRRVRGLLDDV